jgi:hypothetical protein
MSRYGLLHVVHNPDTGMWETHDKLGFLGAYSKESYAQELVNSYNKVETEINLPMKRLCILLHAEGEAYDRLWACSSECQDKLLQQHDLAKTGEDEIDSLELVCDCCGRDLVTV